MIHIKHVWRFSRIFCPFLSGQSGTIKIFNLSARKERLCLTDHTDVVRTLSFGPDGHTLCSGSDDSKIIIWETTNGQFKASNNMHSLGILKVMNTFALLIRVRNA